MGVTDRCVLLEACVASVADAVAAVQNGAQRLELNVGIELGGLTPTLGLLEQTKEAVDVPVLVMIRTRGGGFCYTPSEKRLMIRDAQALLELGADGVVTGALTSQGEPDTRLIEDMRNVCRERELVFHMAFDLLKNSENALEEMIGLRVNRILTAGRQRTALAGQEVISKLVDKSNGRIEVLPGGGVNAENVRELLMRTGCSQVHGTFKVMRNDPAGNVCSGQYPALDANQVRWVSEELDRYDAES
jgi:copper homeostasis protein